MENEGIIFNPKVYLIGRPRIVWGDTNYKGLMDFLKDNGYQEFLHTAMQLDHKLNAQLLAEVGGRLCYDSFNNPRPGGQEAIIKRMVEETHGSVFAHGMWTFIFTGVSRTLTHELVRHAVGTAISQRSQRYVDESNSNVIANKDIADDPECFTVLQTTRNITVQAYKQIREKLYDKFILEAYHQMLGRSHDKRLSLTGIPVDSSGRIDGCGLTVADRTTARKRASGSARAVLMGSTETAIQFSGSARAWRNIIEQRGSRFADREIRLLINLILPILQIEAPAIFGDYKLEDLPDDTKEIATLWRKI